MCRRRICLLGVAIAVVANILHAPTPVKASAGDLTTIAGQNLSGFSGDGGQATQARLNNPKGVAVDFAGNIFIADSFNSRIRKVDSSGVITTFASDIYTPMALAVDSNGNVFAAAFADQVFKISQSGEVTPLINDPSLSSFEITGLALDSTGTVYISSESDGLVYKIEESGLVTVIARRSDPSIDDDEKVVSGMYAASDIAIDSSDNLYIADRDNHRVFKRDTSGDFTVFAGTGVQGSSGDRGPAATAQLRRPNSLAIDSAGRLFIGGSSPIRIVDSSARICSITVNTGYAPGENSLSTDNSGSLYFPSGNGIQKIEAPYCLGSAWDEIKSDPEVSLFRQLVESGGRTDSFDACPGSLTVLAPEDSALEDIADQLGISFEALKGNPALVTGIINDHVSRWRLEFRRVEQDLPNWIGDSDLHWIFTQQPAGAEGTRKVGENIYVNGRFITSGKGTCAGSYFKIDALISWPPSGNTTFVEWLGPTTPTNSRNLLFELRFSHPITGLAVANFENSGSQQNCTMSVTKGEALSEFSSNYFLTGLCQGSGTFAPRLKFLPVTAQTGTRFFANPVGPVIDMVQGKVLEIRKTGDGAGSVESTISAIECGPLCFGVFNTGTQVTLRPTAEPGSIFAGWSGACRGVRTCTVRMASAQTVTAEFQRSRALVISRVGSGSGSVTARSAGVNCPPSAHSPCTSWHLRGQSITLQATPARGSRFVGWMGACTGSRTCTIPAVKGTVSPTTHVFAVFNRGR